MATVAHRLAGALVLLLGLLAAATKGDPLTFTESTLPGRFRFLDWNNADQRIILAFVGPTPHRSTDHGKTFAPLTSKLEGIEGTNPAGVREVFLNPTSRSFWVFLGWSSSFWTSRDSGETFTKNEVKTEAGESIVLSLVVFHPSDPENLLGLALLDPKCTDITCFYKLYVSMDFGRSWALIDSEVTSADWFVAGKSSVVYQKKCDETKYYDASEVPLCLYEASESSKFQSGALLLSSVEQFACKNTFLFAHVRIDFTATFSAQLPLSQKYSTELYVRNGAAPKVFSKTNLHSPNLKAFKILETEDGVMLLKIPKKTGFTAEMDNYFGALCKGDFSGTGFICPIEHLITQNQEIQLEDFKAVQSLDATFIASYALPKEEGGSSNFMVSKISWNHGSDWKELKTSGNMEKKSLTLLGDFYVLNYNTSSGIHSEKNAPGSIIANGQLDVTFDDYLAGKVKSDIYYSFDGGHNFTKILEGPHFCQFLNEGSIIFCIPGGGKGYKTNKLSYSLDRGSTWTTVTFATYPVEVLSIDSETGFGLALVIIASHGTDTVIYATDLRQLQLRKCEEKDYETWTPNDGRQGGMSCIMGQQIMYQRPLSSAKCWSDRNFAPKIVAPEACPCADQDFECDLEHTRVGDQCVIEFGVTPIPFSACEKGVEYYSSGYRKIAGNLCNSNHPDAKARDKPTMKKCDQGDVVVFSFQAVAIGLGVTIPLSLIGMFALGSVFFRRRGSKAYKAVRTEES